MNTNPVPLAQMRPEQRRAVEDANQLIAEARRMYRAARDLENKARAILRKAGIP